VITIFFNRLAAILVLSFAGFTLVAHAGQTEEGSEVSGSSLVETFTPPSQKNVTPPKYPRTRQLRNQEGWVQLNFMVDPEGKPYDITVADSSKDSGFEESAMKSVEQWEYQPAVLNGEAIDAGAGVFITFELSGGEPGATARFVTRYRRLMKFIDQDDKEQASLIFDKLENMSRNLYEEAYLNLARYNYYKAWGGDPTILYGAISRAAAMDKDRGFLPDELLTSVLASKFALEIKLNKLAKALKTAAILQRRDLPEAKQSQIQAVVEQIQVIKETGQFFAAEDIIRQDNRGFHNLVHNRFHLAEVEGDIAELRLHCDRGYVGFIFDPERVYSVSDDWDNCSLVLIGTPGTRYTLMQGNF
jgi:TonB family protein